MEENEWNDAYGGLENPNDEFDEFDEFDDFDDSISTTTKEFSKYVNHHDYIYTQSLTEINISKEHNELLPIDKYIFSYKLVSKRYELIEQCDIKCLITKKYLYEIVNTETAIRLYMDLDLHEDNYMSYSQIQKLCDRFKEFLKNYYDYGVDFGCNIHVSMRPNQLLQSFDIDEKIINSCHIIFDIIIESHLQAKQIVRTFKNTKNLLTEHIDLKVYKRRMKFRTLFQSKEQIYIDTPVSGRILTKLKLVNNRLIQDSTIEIKDLISYVIPNNVNVNQLIEICPNKKIFSIDYPKVLNVVIEEEIINLTYKNYTNIYYHIDQLTKLKKHVDEIDVLQLKFSYIWKRNLKLIIATLILANVKWTNILNHELIELFLEKSKVEKYDNNKSVLDNKTFIQNIINSKILSSHYFKDFFEPLQYKIIFFIYKSLNLNPNDTILITEQKINKDTFLLISYGNNLSNEYLINAVVNKSKSSKKNTSKLINSLKHKKPVKENLITAFICPNETNTNIIQSLFIQNKDILLIDYKITFDKDTNKQIPFSNNQVQLALEEIKFNTNVKEKCCYPIKNVQDLKDVTIDAYENRYLTAPVGAGKSYIVLRQDLDAILKNSSNQILVVTDTISMANKTFADMGILVESFGFSKDIIKLYNKTSSKFTNKTKILVCCYDSILKFQEIFTPTHLIIDEFVNVCKRISGTKKIGTDKNNIRNYFFKLIQNCYLKFYDADVDDLILQLIKNNFNKNINVVSLINYTQLNHNIILTSHDKNISHIFWCIANNYKISISSTTSSMAMIELMDDITTNFNFIKCVYIYCDGAVENKSTKNTDKSLKNELCSNTELWKNYDIVMYSPAITTGISFNDRTYFYKHFHFCCPKTADATQNTQMINRVRCNLTNSIQISISHNTFGTLKNMDILNINQARIYNFEIFNTNVINNTNVQLMPILLTEVNNSLTNNSLTNDSNIGLNTKYSIENTILDIEEFHYRSKTYRIIYDFFNKSYKYGARNLSINFFNKYEVTNEIQPINTNNTNEIHEPIYQLVKDRIKQKYEEATFLVEFKPNVNDEELEFCFDTSKTGILMKLNYSHFIWHFHHNLKLIFELLCKIKLEQTNKLELIEDIKYLVTPYKAYNYTIINKIINALEINANNDALIIELYYGRSIYFNIENILDSRNRIDYLFDFYQNDMFGKKDTCIIYNHQQKFIKSNNIAYYEVKHLIYSLYENSFKSKDEVTEINKNCLFGNNDLIKFIEFIYGLYISFKIFDMISVTNVQLEQLYLNTSTDMGLKINKKLYNSKLEELFKHTQNHYEYLLSLLNKPVYKKDIQHKQQLVTAFNVLNLEVETGHVERDPNIYIFVKSNSFHYRFQKYRLILDKNVEQPIQPLEYFEETNDDDEDEVTSQTGDIININSSSQSVNDLDDMYYQLNNPNIIINDAVGEIYVNTLPKISLYKHYLNIDAIKLNNKAPSRRTANAEYLFYVAVNFCKSNIENLIELLETTSKDILTKFIEPTTLKQEEFKYVYPNELYKFEDETKITKEAQKEAKKEAKESTTKQNKELRESTIKCDICGGKYKNKPSYYKEHCNTKKHQLALNK